MKPELIAAADVIAPPAGDCSQPTERNRRAGIGYASNPRRNLDAELVWKWGWSGRGGERRLGGEEDGGWEAGEGWASVVCMRRVSVIIGHDGEGNTLHEREKPLYT